MDTYEIWNGVRRAKAVEFFGRLTIAADIYAPDGQFLDARDLPLDVLLSPKGILDLRADALALIRFRRRQSLLLAGAALDPIEVVPGRRGTPLFSVRVFV